MNVRDISAWCDGSGFVDKYRSRLYLVDLKPRCRRRRYKIDLKFFNEKLKRKE